VLDELEDEDEDGGTTVLEEEDRMLRNPSCLRHISGDAKIP